VKTGTTTENGRIPSLPHSRKRPRDKEESTSDTYHRNESGSGNKTATGSVEFVVDPELADEVEISVLPHSRKRGNVKNDAAVEATERDVSVSENAQVADHRESHEDIAVVAAALHPMNSDQERTSQNDGSANKHSQKASTSKPSSYSPWEDRLSELADYRKIHGHCNVPRNYSENTKLANGVLTQRKQYKLQQEGKTSHMATSRIQEFENLGFEWGSFSATWKDHLS
jgi:flagellar biosynthesis GTPase FlhF